MKSTTKTSDNKCERCGKAAYIIEPCDYCSRKICRACVKSSARESKIKRNVICKDCWGNIPKRRKYKSA